MLVNRLAWVVALLACVWLWHALPLPKLDLSPEYFEAKAKREAYQLAREDTEAIETLLTSTHAIVEEATERLPHIDDPVERLESMVGYTIKVNETLSRHPDYPEITASEFSSAFWGIHEAAGLGNGVPEFEMVTAMQDHPEIMEKRVIAEEQLKKEHGIGYAEPLSKTLSHNLTWVFRLALLIFIAGWLGALVPIIWMMSKGCSLVSIMHRFGISSAPAMLLVGAWTILLLPEAMRFEEEDAATLNLWMDNTSWSFRVRRAIVVAMAMLTNLLFLQAAFAGSFPVVRLQGTTVSSSADIQVDAGDDVPNEFSVGSPALVTAIIVPEVVLTSKGTVAVELVIGKVNKKARRGFGLGGAGNNDGGDLIVSPVREI